MHHSFDMSRSACSVSADPAIADPSADDGT